QPRCIATSPAGSRGVTLYWRGKLGRVDPATQKVLKEYALPAGERGGPYAVTIDGAGVVWANEIQTDTVVRLDPGTGALRVFALPSKAVGIRKMVVDADGRLWYKGSHHGRLGVIGEGGGRGDLPLARLALGRHDRRQHEQPGG